ncbi:hypothetical protein U2F10_21780 [Leptothoe sp. EHU-05/26/07-4]
MNNPKDLRRQLAQKISEQEHREQRAQLVFDHRRSGGQINRDFAQQLADQGFANKDGRPWSVECLHHDYQEFVKHLTIFHRDTYQYQQTLQLMRLEHNLNLLNGYIQAFTLDPGSEKGLADLKPSHVQMLTLLAKESRQTVESISKLTGANAPVEVVVNQRLQGEVDSIVSVLRQGLDDDTFQQVAQCLAKGMDLVQEKANDPLAERADLN